jgi:beta-galactosidase GanA
MKLAVLFLFLVPALTAEPIPRLTKVGDQHQLIVNGQPFIVLGAQTGNSSGWPSQLDSVWKQAAQMHVNTLEIPIYWEEIEPEPGRFNFQTVDALVEGARANGFRLVLLWFATWKNGAMDYAPAWVKQDTEKYPRMIDPGGRPVRVLSPHSNTNRDADSTAFAAVMRHLKQIDGTDRTVIMIQVQNEPGSLFTVRDNSEASNKLFAGAAPADLVKKLGKQSGTWSEVFGPEADEAFAAYHVARYVDAVAEAGKKEYPLPMSVNVWLRERKEAMRPGQNYPSGGAVSNMLDVWKAAAPNIDVLAPDIYVMDYVGYREVCESYLRPDNPLLIPETGGWAQFTGYMFYALADYGAIGWAPFGFNSPNDTGTLNPALNDVAANFGLLGPALPKIVELQASGTLKSAVEQDQLTVIHNVFDQYETVTYFGTIRQSYGGNFAGGTEKKTGRMLIGQSAPDEFWLMGFDSRIRFLPRRGSKQPETQFTRVEEGHFENGVWTVDRLLNGDQAFFGLGLPASGAIYRVKLMSYGDGVEAVTSHR